MKVLPDVVTDVLIDLGVGVVFSQEEKTEALSVPKTS